jgi:hypothetical protein
METSLSKGDVAAGLEFTASGAFDEASWAARVQADANAAAAAAAMHSASQNFNAMQLWQWVHNLQRENDELQRKVKELEQWKIRTLEEMRDLRKIQQSLKKRIGPSADEDREIEKPPPGLKKTISPAPDNAPDLSKISSPPGLEPPSNSPPSYSADANEELLRTYTAPARLTQAEPLSVLVAEDEVNPRPKLEPRPSLESICTEGILSQEGVITKPSDRGIRAEWRIGHLSAKLRRCMGKQLVSPAFEAFDMTDLKLMISVGDSDDSAAARNRKTKEQYNKKVTEGPLDARMKLKVPCSKPPYTKMTYRFMVGDKEENQTTPITHDFSESTVSNAAEFGCDWLAEVDGDCGITVSVEIFSK